MAPPACKEAAVAAIDRLRRTLGLAARTAAPLLKWLGLAGGALLSHHARAVDLPEERSEAMVHVYDGGGVRATGPAVLVRKNIADKFSLSGKLYIDMVSNASIDVVTTASPYRETRTEFGLGLDHVAQGTLMHVGLTRSSEPDYRATTASLDVSQEVFGGMTTVSLGFGRGQDDVGKHGQSGYFDHATHWQYRLGATQILSPRWLLSVNGEALADDGFLGSPYRVARVFGAVVPERVPRTRSARAIKFRLLGDVSEPGGLRSAVHADYRYYRDTWGIQAHTLEAGFSHYMLPGLLADTYVRLNRQGDALFYSDDASSETRYLTRNRQLSAFSSTSVGAKLSRAVGGLPAGHELRLGAAYELVHFNYSHFTDLRTGQRYGFNGHVLQLLANAKF
jgi:hypothetical protein